MKPTEFSCSPVLAALLDEAVRHTEIFKQGTCDNLFPTSIRPFPEPKKELIEEVRGQMHAALMQRLYDTRGTLPKAAITGDDARDRQTREQLIKDCERLNQLLVGMSSGHGSPVVHLKGLPEGLTGSLATFGLMSIAGNIKPPKEGETTAAEYARLKRSGPALWGQMLQRVHRDSNMPLLRVLKGVCVGARPLTTVFHDTDSFVEEVARHYRKEVYGVPSKEPLDEAILTEVRGVMSEPAYKISELRRQPLLIEDPCKGEGARRLHPKFWGAPNTYFVSPLPEDPRNTKQYAIVKATHAALVTLKGKDGVVIGSDEAVLFNNSFVLHGPGLFVEDARATPGQSRELINMGMLPMQDQHRRGDGKQHTFDQGYTLLADPMARSKA